MLSLAIRLGRLIVTIQLTGNLICSPICHRLFVLPQCQDDKDYEGIAEQANHHQGKNDR